MFVQQLFMANIINGLRWLDDWPVGLKLNTPLSRLFCETYIGMTTFWQRRSSRHLRSLADDNHSYYQLPSHNAFRDRLVTHLPLLLRRKHVHIRPIGHGFPRYATSAVRHPFKRGRLSRRDGVAVYVVESISR